MNPRQLAHFVFQHTSSVLDSLVALFKHPLGVRFLQQFEVGRKAYHKISGHFSTPDPFQHHSGRPTIRGAGTGPQRLSLSGVNQKVVAYLYILCPRDMQCLAATVADHIP